MHTEHRNSLDGSVKLILRYQQVSYIIWSEVLDSSNQVLTSRHSIDGCMLQLRRHNISHYTYAYCWKLSISVFINNNIYFWLLGSSPVLLGSAVVYKVYDQDTIQSLSLQGLNLPANSSEREKLKTNVNKALYNLLSSACTSITE